MQDKGDYLVFFALVAVVVASGGDLIADLSEGVTTVHVIQEGILLIVALGCLGWLLINWRSQRTRIEALRAELEEVLPDPAIREVKDARERLSQVIARQFAAWSLTRSEKEVGLLLLKGLSFKEIGLLRETSEKTVRLQASAIYQKAGVTGRHAFAAWFIEDFL